MRVGPSPHNHHDDYHNHHDNHYDNQRSHHNNHDHGQSVLRWNDDHYHGQSDNHYHGQPVQLLVSHLLWRERRRLHLHILLGGDSRASGDVRYDNYHDDRSWMQLQHDDNAGGLRW